MEPILSVEKRRFTVFPIEYPTIWENYLTQRKAFWQPHEVDFSKDYEDFEKLDENEKYFIKMVLGFFAASDGIVNWNISEKFLQDVQIMEARIAYSFQMAMENIHGETYSLMLDNIVKDTEEKELLFNALEKIESIKSMTDFAFRWIKSEKSFAHRLIAFAVVEGVMFSSAFAGIFWLKKRLPSKMMGLIKSNEFIARDEGIHTMFACELYHLLQNKLPRDEVIEIIDEGVKISQVFSEDALHTRLLGINAEMMNQYISYVGDVLLTNLGYEKYYQVSNPFSFCETIGMLGKTNFFEARVSDYALAHTSNSKAHEFVLSDDF